LKKRVALHEVLDNTVEFGALVTESKLANGQSSEILGGLWDGLKWENDSQISQKYRRIPNGAHTTKEPNDN